MDKHREHIVGLAHLSLVDVNEDITRWKRHQSLHDVRLPVVGTARRAALSIVVTIADNTSPRRAWPSAASECLGRACPPPPPPTARLVVVVLPVLRVRDGRSGDGGDPF